MALHLTDASLDWALRHAQAYGDTDIFPDTFEFDALAQSWDTVKAFLKSKDILEWTVRPARRCLVPKHRFGFRISTQLDPLDFLIFTALIKDVGEKLEMQRIPITQNIVHSYRFLPASDGRMYSEDQTYRSFQKASQTLTDDADITHVLIADIADFFPRIYTHRIDNALDSALGVGHMHSDALKNLIGHWAGAYSYGIPVGSAASRLISEVTIADVDQLLLSEGVRYVRYSDDYRIFCKSEAQAYKFLTIIARGLFENHGLTLQQHKTKIVTTEEFRRIYLRENDRREIDTLSERFYELLDQVGIVDTYEDIDLDSLPEEQQQAIATLNLEGILTEQLEEEEPDLSLLKFLLRRLGQLGLTDQVDLIFDNFSKFVPVIRETIQYLLRLNMPSADIKALGQRLIETYEDENSSASHLEYSRMYMLRPFAVNGDWNSEDKYVRLYNEAVDEFSRREILLALGRSKQQFWFRTRKQYLQELSPWLRRAFIYSASCLPADEYKHWIRGIDSQLDTVERAIATWAQKFAISDPF